MAWDPTCGIDVEKSNLAASRAILARDEIRRRRCRDCVNIARTLSWVHATFVILIIFQQRGSDAVSVE